MPRRSLQQNEGLSNAVTLTLRVRYAETDQMQRAYYGRYLEWFEASRAEYCRQRGLDYAAMESKRGLYIPVIEAHVRYIAPARYDDELTIRAYVLERKSRTLRMGYVVQRNETLIAEGETAHVLVNRDGRPCVFPEDIAVLFW